MSTGPGDASAASEPAAPSRSRWFVPATDDSGTGIVAVLFVALLLRFWQLGFLSVWTDEATAWTESRLPFRALIDFCIHKDASPPLFYLLTGWALKLGDNETNLRLVSALASVALVWVTYRLARLGADRRTASIAAALLALSPFQLMYAQEARTYVLVALWTVTALWLFARAVLFERPRSWVPFVIVSALGLWTQDIFLLGVGVQAAVIVLSPVGRRHLRAWLLAMLAVAVLYAPWWILSRTGSNLASSHWYVPGVNSHNMFQVLRALFLSPLPLVTPTPTAHLPGLDHYMPRALAWAILIVTPMLPLANALRALSADTPRGRMTRFAIAALLLPILAVLIASLHRPLWLQRYFVFLGPMVAVLVAYGVTALKPRVWSIVWLALLLLVSGYGAFRYYTDHSKEPWRQAVAWIGQHGDPSREIAIVTFDPDPLVYYDSRRDAPFRWVAAAHPDVPFHDAFTEAQLAWIERTIRDSTATAPEVWVVVRSPNSPVRRRIADMATAAAADGRVFAESETLDSATGPIRLARYVRMRVASTAPDTLRATPR